MKKRIGTYLRKHPFLYCIAVSRRKSRRWIGRSLPERLSLLQRTFRQVRDGLPSTIAFEPVSACTYDCEFCIIRDLKTHKYRRQPRMTFAQFKKIIDDIWP